MDRKTNLLKKLQAELDRRTQIENEAVRLMENCEFEKAQELLGSLDDSVVREIERELDRLDAKKKQKEDKTLRRIRKSVNIEKAIVEFAARERKEARESKEKEKNQVCLDPDSYMAKEIKYQTALLHQIVDEVREVKMKKKQDGTDRPVITCS